MAATDVSRTSTLATRISTASNGETASPTTALTTLSTVASASTTVIDSDAPSPSPSPSSVTEQPARGSGVSGGAVAGAVVGTAAGVALLTFALTFWWMRRGTKKSGLHRYTGRGGESSEGQLKRSSTVASGGRRRSTWQEHLPQPLDDQTVRKRVKAMLDQAEVHVENNFSDVGVGVGETGRELELELEEALEEALAAFDTPHLPAPLAALMAEARRPTALIKHALVYRLVTCDDLLPPTMTELPRVLHQRPDRPRSALQALSHWRRLTAYLYPPPAADPSFKAHRDARIEDHVDQFLLAFSPWLSASASPDRRTNLIGVFHAAADVSYMLFSQLSALKYDWAARPDGSMVSIPGLLRANDENGAPLPYSHVLLHAILVSSF